MTAEWLIEWVKGLSEIGVYFFLAISAILENVFPPYPGDTVTVFCGFLAAHEVITLPWAFLSVLIGNLIGAWIMYYAGDKILNYARKLHQKFQKPKFLKTLLSNLISEESMTKTSKWFSKWGILFIIISRFSAGIRFFVSIIAGISQMNIIIFSLTFTLGVFLWNSLLLLGGYMLGDNWEIIVAALKVYNQVVIFLILLIIGTIYYWRRKKKKAIKNADI